MLSWFQHLCMMAISEFPMKTLFCGCYHQGLVFLTITRFFITFHPVYRWTTIKHRLSGFETWCKYCSILVIPCVCMTGSNTSVSIVQVINMFGQTFSNQHFLSKISENKKNFPIRHDHSLDLINTSSSAIATPTHSSVIISKHSFLKEWGQTNGQSKNESRCLVLSPPFIGETWNFHCAQQIVTWREIFATHHHDTYINTKLVLSTTRRQ